MNYRINSRPALFLTVTVSFRREVTPLVKLKNGEAGKPSSPVELTAREAQH